MTSEQLVELAASKGFRSVVVEPKPPPRPARRPKPDKPDGIPF
jgi:hypothetical protein